MTPLERVTERINRNGDIEDRDTPVPLLTLTEFFSGNEIVGSIGCNLIPTPLPSEFHELLASISRRSNVADVLVQITMFDNPDEWPFSDAVWIITSAMPEEVAGWFSEAVRPDECSQGWSEGVTFEPYIIPSGMHPVCCWWD